MNQNDRDAFEDWYPTTMADTDSPHDSARHSWQAATERSGERIRVLEEALLKSRQYVESTQAMIAGAIGHENTIVKPDLDMINAALKGDSDDK